MKIRRNPTIIRVIKTCELGPATVVYAILFLLCSVSVWMADPSQYGFGDGLWYTFQAVTTIGFGDIVETSTFVRVCTVIMSVYSIFYIALLTGAFVSYSIEVHRLKREGSLSETVYMLENLEDLSREELAELSKRVRKRMDE